jgi:hypothetical protein
MVSLPTRITLTPDLLFQELEGEAIVLNPRTEHYYSLDDVGTRMWQLLAEHCDVAIVVQQLLAEYHVEEAMLRQDLAQLIALLADAGLLTTEWHT